MIKIISFSSKVTKQIGLSVAQQIAHRESLVTAPTFILLEGDLGAGKTTFTVGFLEYFGVKPKAASPTFTIMKHHRSKEKYNTKQILDIYHMDAYRLRSKKDLDMLGFNDIKKRPHTVVLIEWPGNIKGVKFQNAIRIKFEYGENETERGIEIK
ncbi:MAG: tRNA (adenosine(37)-N6)-threonylcarbamoyltransferase complex ATPase subunit type 1 TsaE [Candidatus Paceibacterota bacterium]